MDAFFASVEQLDNPDIAGLPVVVGGNNDRGVVAAASYEARKFGIRSAMPTHEAVRRCPQLIICPARFDRYKEISNQVREVFAEVTDLIEPLSIDEAYLDISNNKLNIEDSEVVAHYIKDNIHKKTGLTASAGLSYNKFLAKMASDMDKPNGLFVINPEEVHELLGQLPIHQFYGIGKVTAEKMRQLGIHRGKDLRALEKEQLHRFFGNQGSWYYHIVRGEDARLVKNDRTTKSIGVETTIGSPLQELPEVWQKIDKLIPQLWQRTGKRNLQGRTVIIKLKFEDFTQITRSHTEQKQIETIEWLQHITRLLLEQTYPFSQGIRLVGVSLSNFEALPEDPQLHLEF
ncbi:MAG: DNA polymerase-4 [Flavobacteriales bacterium]|jgi:DNA polymerase-4